MKSKFTKGKTIKSIIEFANSKAESFVVKDKNREQTYSKTIVIGWSYRKILGLILSGWIAEADLLPEYKKNVDPKGRVKINE